MEAMRAYTRWRALSSHEQRLAAKSGVAIAASVVALRLFSVDRTLRMASRPIKGSTKNVIGEMVTAVERAGRYVPGATCLSKSLALAWMLRGKGVEADVRIGVKTAGGFDAHAWVECDGATVGSVPPGYAAFDP